MGWKQHLLFGAGLVLLARALPLHSQLHSQPFRETQGLAASLLHDGEAAAKEGINAPSTVVEVSSQEKTEGSDGEVAAKDRSDATSTAVGVSSQETAESSDGEVAANNGINAASTVVEVSSQEIAESNDGEVAAKDGINATSTVGEISSQESAESGNGEVAAKDGINATSTVIEGLSQESAESSSVGSPNAATGAGIQQQQNFLVETCEYMLGLSKFTWAFLCDMLALLVILLCIPLLLTCSRRRPIGAPIFDCTFSSWKDQSALLASQKTGTHYSQLRDARQG